MSIPHLIVYWLFLHFRGRVHTLKTCLDRGLDINVTDGLGFSLLIYSLHCPCASRRIRTVRYLLNNDIDCLKKDIVTERDALLWSTHGNLEDESMCILQNNCVDLHWRDVYGYSCLHYGVYHSQTRLITAACHYAEKYVLSVDVPTSGDPVNSITPYILARRIRHDECADILVKAGGACEQQHDLMRHNNCNNMMKFAFHGDDWSKREHHLPNEAARETNSSQGSVDAVMSGHSNKPNLYIPVYSMGKMRDIKKLPKSQQKDIHKTKPLNMRWNAKTNEKNALPVQCTVKFAKAIAISAGDVLIGLRNYQNEPQRRCQTISSTDFTSRVLADHIQHSRFSAPINRSNNEEEDDPLMMSIKLQGTKNKNNKMISQMMAMLSDERRPTFARSAPKPDSEVLNCTSYPWPKPEHYARIGLRSKYPSFARTAKKITNVASILRRMSNKGSHGERALSSFLRAESVVSANDSLVSGTDSVVSGTGGNEDTLKKSLSTNEIHVS